MLINSGYIIAIPSYNRAHELSKKTLKLLNNYKVNPEIIYIFVANEEEELIFYYMSFYANRLHSELQAYSSMG